MAFLHPLTPPHLTDAARRIGLLLGDGRISYESVRECCHQWARHQDKLSKRGLATHLVWEATDTARHRIRMAARAESAIRQAVRPLIEASATTAQIEDAAGEARGVLEWPEVITILRDELARSRANKRWAR